MEHSRKLKGNPVVRIQVRALKVWSDMLLRGLAWANDGRDVVLAVQFASIPAGLSCASALLTCTWVSDLRVDLNLARTGGMPMTWDVSFAQTNGRWTLEFDFAS